MRFLIFAVLFWTLSLAAEASAAKSIPIDISAYLNNKGFGTFPGDGNFDGSGGTYPATYLPSSPAVYNGITFDLVTNSSSDNIAAANQTISLPKGKFFSIHTLTASVSDDTTSAFTITYADNSTGSLPFRVPTWWTFPYPARGAFILPFRYTNESVDWNKTMIFETESRIDATKEVVSLTLPGSEDLHIFAISAVPVGVGLEVQYARSTTKWVDGTDKTQLMEVVVNNIGDTWVLSNSSVEVTIESSGIETVTPAVIKRLRPGDQARVQVGVINKPGVTAGSNGTATVRLQGAGVNSTTDFAAVFGIPEYEPTLSSVLTHETPDWYNNAKFGIFIHWGVYAVPGYGNVGPNEQYAEWYWWYLQQPDEPSDVYDYHLRTYGPNIMYDDFIQNFTAAHYDPKDWVDLFADAGAKYFVITSKHHEGYMLLDLPENVTKRTSVALPPHRNLLKELFDAADTYQPQLKRATYYSLPEWFNPAYQKYGFSNWPGGNATNPYTNQTLGYAGFVAVDDYITDIQVPQMEAIADLGTEIMWCDIGGPNKTIEVVSSWFNAAAKEGRQVVFNDRCGVPGDFSTPEYARYAAVTPTKWESNLGMDPFSYGYNRATPLSSYMNATTLVTSLLDIISKNGNFLLDIGPMANGTIVQPEADTLREAGAWIQDHAEAIYNTTYWFVSPGDGEVRYTITGDAFYILVLSKPNSTLVLDDPVPWVQGDDIVVIGGKMNGTVVESELGNDGVLNISVPEKVADADSLSWVFKISY